MSLSYTYEEGERYLIGYLDDYPEHWTQGEDLQDLEDHLREIYELVQDGTLAQKKHGVLQLA